MGPYRYDFNFSPILIASHFNENRRLLHLLFSLDKVRLTRNPPN
ncbi:hypothetical protein CLOSTMETH_01576 [[Clostridium] methylpentosum DSM 5476]|uniref:Uncharacterized protein n=1 Tax=[Clostridium] methylpentosum DSM 5476 TaxID=537013 RepID=C0ECK5_9FIRM|nr:hypothetical protein CLOSTMETH_01576 [[Clostridium] methylpentosum DSM 5476]